MASPSISQTKAGEIDVVVFSQTPYRSILRLASPTMGAMLLQSVVNEIDILFFRELGVDAVAAQAALIPSLLIVWGFGGTLSAISVGVQAMTARRYAEGNKGAAGAVLTNAMALCLVGGATFTVVALLSLRWIVGQVMDLPPRVEEIAYVYSRFRLFGIVSMASTIGIKAFFDGIGKPYVHFFASLIMNIFNVFFCWLFIFGKMGVPTLGAPGAGLGAFLATWIGFIIVIFFALFSNREFGIFRLKNLSKAVMKELVVISWPAALATSVMMLGFGLFANFASKLDGDVKFVSGMDTALAIHGAATTDIVGIMKLVFTACIAFGTATATFVSQSLGRKRPDLATLYGWSSVKLGLVLFGALGMLLGYLFPEKVCSFVSHSPAVQKVMLGPLRVMGFVMPLIATALILSEALFGAGATIYVAVTQVLLIFGVLVPLSWWLSLHTPLGLIGMWIAAAVYGVFACVAMSLKFRSSSWKNIVL